MPELATASRGRLPAGMVVRDDTVAARAPWSAVVEAGQLLSIVDLGGNQAVDFLVYDARNTAERYSASDTIAMQGNVFVTTGSILRSCEGGGLMTVVAGDCGRDVPVGGAWW